MKDALLFLMLAVLLICAAIGFGVDVARLFGWL
ncbi:hypothetical protein HNQ75_004569 [Rhizobium flavum]|uniref:Uncharacterized protein n=1 Tax=Pseudorhizobium flavum TaxID=1335061 RepID=A0A7W9Z1Z8_9HYPH|nr:hypothetical protein [Pseudorhizobium flavum]